MVSSPREGGGSKEQKAESKVKGDGAEGNGGREQRAEGEGGKGRARSAIGEEKGRKGEEAERELPWEKRRECRVRGMETRSKSESDGGKIAE